MKIAIITVCKNAERSIERTILSVVTQTHQNIEYIIVDGASTDNTLEIIKKYEKEVSSRHASTCPEFIEGRITLHYISEPDTGIYNAMNKGIGLATGDVLYFLNAGDVLFSRDTVGFFVRQFSDYKSMYAAYGNVILEYPNGKFVEKKFDKVSRYFLYHETINHQSIFFRRSVFKELGPFNEKYNICSDHEKTMQMVSGGLDMRYFDKKVCFYKMDGVSSNPENYSRYKSERHIISGKYYKIWETVLFSNFFYRKCRVLLRKLGLNVYG